MALAMGAENVVFDATASASAYLHDRHAGQVGRRQVHAGRRRWPGAHLYAGLAMAALAGALAFAAASTLRRGTAMGSAGSPMDCANSFFASSPAPRRWDAAHGASKSFLVASSDRHAWMISAAWSPKIWQPSTLSVLASTTSFIRCARPPAQRVQQRPEDGFVDVDAVALEPAPFPRDRPTPPISGRGEDRAGHMTMIGPGGIVLEGGLDKAHGFVDRHRRQLHPVGDIADGIDMRRAGAGIIIHHHFALLAQFDARLFDMQRIGVGQAADRQHDLVAFDHARPCWFRHAGSRRAFRPW